MTCDDHSSEQFGQYPSDFPVFWRLVGCVDLAVRFVENNKESCAQIFGFGEKGDEEEGRESAEVASSLVLKTPG